MRNSFHKLTRTDRGRAAARAAQWGLGAVLIGFVLVLVRVIILTMLADVHRPPSLRPNLLSEIQRVFATSQVTIPIVVVGFLLFATLRALWSRPDPRFRSADHCARWFTAAAAVWILVLLGLATWFGAEGVSEVPGSSLLFNIVLYLLGLAYIWFIVLPVVVGTLLAVYFTARTIWSRSRLGSPDRNAPPVT